MESAWGNMNVVEENASQLCHNIQQDGAYYLCGALGQHGCSLQPSYEQNSLGLYNSQKETVFVGKFEDSPRSSTHCSYAAVYKWYQSQRCHPRIVPDDETNEEIPDSRKRSRNPTLIICVISKRRTMARSIVGVNSRFISFCVVLMYSLTLVARSFNMFSYAVT